MNDKLCTMGELNKWEHNAVSTTTSETLWAPGWEPNLWPSDYLDRCSITGPSCSKLNLFSTNPGFNCIGFLKSKTYQDLNNWAFWKRENLWFIFENHTSYHYLHKKFIKTNMLLIVSLCLWLIFDTWKTTITWEKRFDRRWCKM